MVAILSDLQFAIITEGLKFRLSCKIFISKIYLSWINGTSDSKDGPVTIFNKIQLLS